MSKKGSGMAGVSNFVIEIVFILAMIGYLATSTILGANTINALDTVQTAIIGVIGLVGLVLLFQMLSWARRSWSGK